MKKQGDSPDSAHLSCEKSSWGVSRDKGNGKRRGSQSDQLFPSKLSRISNRGNNSCCLALACTDGSNNSSLHCSSCDNGRNIPVDISDSCEPKPTDSSSVPINTNSALLSVSTVIENASEHSKGQLILSCTKLEDTSFINSFSVPSDTKSAFSLVSPFCKNATEHSSRPIVSSHANLEDVSSTNSSVSCLNTSALTSFSTVSENATEHSNKQMVLSAKLEEEDVNSTNTSCDSSLNTNGALSSVSAACENTTEHSDGLMVLTCELEDVSSNTGANMYLCGVNDDRSPAYVSETSVGQDEDKESLETNFCHDTVFMTSALVDQLCCDLSTKIPNSITETERDIVLKENYNEIQGSGVNPDDVTNSKTMRLGAVYEECVREINQTEISSLEMLKNFADIHFEAINENQDKGRFSNGRLLSNHDKMPEEAISSGRSSQYPSSDEMVIDEHSLTKLQSSIKAGYIESLNQESSFASKNVADVAKPVKVGSQQEPLPEVYIPDTLQEHEIASDEGEDCQSEDSCNSDVPDEEIEAMLEEGLLRKSEKCEQMVQFNQREKIVLEELGHDHFDVLPEGWVKVTHNSGMPVYLHKTSRVCNITKPYFLGPGSSKKHEIPLSAIPCLQYRRALDEEHASREKFPVTGPGGIPLPNACIETAEENKARHSLPAEQVYEYCKKKFPLKEIITRVKKGSTKKKTPHQKQISRPTLPEGTKLIKFPVENKRGHNCGMWLENTPRFGSQGPLLNNTRKRKEWILNPNGKSYVCILHEYVQHALKKQPSYIFKETDRPEQPYSASVMIDKVQYGVGCGSSKKHAKSEAAKQTLEILIPEMREKIEEDRRAGHCKASASCNTDLSIFDEIRIEDPRVAELCAKTTEPSPYAILLTCLQRNFGLGEMDISCEVRAVRHLNIEYMMMVGKHTAVVMCKNKRDGKQRTSQAILQKLHPHIKSWGSILRMYGSSSIKSMKDKKQEEQEITFLQSKAEENEPNYAILGKLEGIMLKMAREYKSIGKFIPPSDEKLPSSAGADLNTDTM